MNATQPNPHLHERPTSEMTFWARALEPTLDPANQGFGRAVGAFLVTPIAHVAWNSLSFQVHLFEVFHRGPIARIGHYLLMPLINLAVLGLVLGLPAWLSVPLVGAWLTWQLASLIAHRLPGVALAATALSVAQVALMARLPEALGLWDLGDPRWMAAAVGLAALQSMTHWPEPDVPPRISGKATWSPAWIYALAADDNGHIHPLRAVPRMVHGSIAGTLNELWAAPRLQLACVVSWLWALGHRPTVLQRWHDQTHAVLAEAHGNPALDAIGTGGLELVRVAYPSTPGS